MTISKDLFLAILSMDSYNRGYEAGIADGGNGDPDGLGETKDVSKIGNATVSLAPKDVSQEFADSAQAAGFYAIAYEITDGAGIDGLDTGDTVISYRGTDGSEAWAHAN